MNLRVAYLRIMAYVPLPISHLLGKTLGLVLAVLPTPMRRSAEINLAHCFPELDEASRRRLCRRSLMHFGCVVTESARIWLRDRQTVLGMVREVVGGEHIERAIAEGKGIVFCSPHLGCWEITSIYVAARFPIRLTAMYRPQSGKVDQLILAGRQHLGARLVPADQQGVKILLSALRRGEAVGILPDQDARYGGVFVNFFGIPANTPALPARLAARSKAPVIIAVGERLPWGRGFRLHLRPASARVADPDPVVGTQVLNDEIERWVREFPEQYWWSYRRFRRRPPGVARVYPRKRRPAQRASSMKVGG